MNYRLLSYTIKRSNGKVDTGLIPYRHHDASFEAIRNFVVNYFSSQAHGYEDLDVEILKTYESDHEWIIDVHQLHSFTQLQQASNYAGDLLRKYNLPELEDRIR